MFLSSLFLVAKFLGLVALIQCLRGLWWLISLLFVQPLSDPLWYLPGPDGSKLQNHFREIMDPSRSPETHERWVKQFGRNFRFHGFGSFDYRLMTLDFRSIRHVLNSPIYEKPWQTRRLLTGLVGRGISAMEGDEHKFQRKLIGPAFTTQALHAYLHVFVQKAEELKIRWDNTMSPCSSQACYIDNSGKTTRLDETVIDVSHWISRATFDIIGLVGFDYAFDSLEQESEEVCMAYRKMFNQADKSPGFKRIAELFFPIIEKLLPDQHIRQKNASMKVIRNAGKELIANRKAVIMAENATAKEIAEKDILSLLIKANLSEDPCHRMSDSDLLDQLSAFLFAGSDTTSLSISWCLHYLSHDMAVQTSLRDELTDFAHLDEFTTGIDDLPLLNAVVKETLRMVPPVHGTIRVATQDDLIPISEPIIMRNEEVRNEIRIRKGSYVHIPIEGLNLSKDIWGEDALLFNPGRWSNLPAGARKHPGLADLMTFSFGPHSCPGWKFSILEMKVFLAALLPHFVFSPAEDIEKFNAILTRPYVKDKFEIGSYLPLKVSRFKSKLDS